ncbi:glycosyltransferase family 4 protein [Defluviitalea saccharophila]|uniref:Glycosyltransferase family 4 protein n=1 Tax=Defluviitalea saccharophila TaxID=879970 RepID=A0ABZ2Y399_9FIRM
MKKVLLIASVDFHFTSFHIPYIKYFQQRGVEVHIAAKSGERTKELEALGVIFHHIDFSRSPYSPKLFRAFFDLKELMSREKFDLIHVHTPVAAFLGRLAARSTKTEPVLYTAHGFHFYKGAPVLNWLIYYPMEKIAARWTHGLITINREDYERGKHFNLKRKNGLFYVHGVGLSLEEYFIPQNFDQERHKEKMGFRKNDKIVVCVGEFTRNKNQQQVIDAMHEAVKIDPDIHVLFVGTGEQEEKLKKYVKQLNLSKNIHFLGYRRDIPEILWAGDAFILTSRREGLPRAMMEAMAAGLPIIATDIRGNRDLISHGQEGYLVPIGDIEKTKEAILQILKDSKQVEVMKYKVKEKIKIYSIESILKEMDQIYKTFINI